MPDSKIKVVVGLSGGVDSSVAALLLKQQGYAVQGLFMRNWQEDDEHCPAQRDLADARAVCARLDIPLTTVNFAEEYWDRVFNYFLDEYKAGRTPNPDILCNKEIKFKAFLNHARGQLQADFIATGHYAQKTQNADQYHLVKAVDITKDQSYFLYTLQQQQLQYSLFPVGGLQKTAVRQLAKQYDLITHNKKDSTGICFIGERKFKQFLSQYLLAQPGNIETVAGKVIGRHDGLMYYTLGQRQGIGIGGVKNAEEAAWYVVDKDQARNVLIIGQGHDHPRLLAQELLCERCDWVNGRAPELPLHCLAKIRYRQIDQECWIETCENNQYRVRFATAQRAITPGQSIVFYQDEYCLGGGIIVKSLLIEKMNE